MTKSVLLVKPDVQFPVKKQGYAGDVGIPTGLLSIAAYIRRENDVDVTIVDQRLESVQGRSSSLESAIKDADIVGVGACTAEVPGAMEVFDMAKSMGKTTVAGGLFPTFNAEYILRTGMVDYVISGEGEIGFSDLIKALDGKKPISSVSGIAMLEGGRIQRNTTQLIENLDDLPIPAYDLVSLDDYAQYGPAAIYAGRGCPLTCKFCTLNELWEFKYRRRPIENILQELDVFKRHGFKRVHFKDETMTLNKSWAGNLFTEIEKANLSQAYKLKSRINGVNERILDIFLRAGVDTIHTGIESVSQETLDEMAKKVKIGSVRKNIDLMLSAGCNVNPVFMLGWPGQRPEDLNYDTNFIRSLGSREGVITYMSFMTPHPGSSFANSIGDDIILLTDNFARYTHKQPVAVPVSLGPNGLKTLVDLYHQIAEDIGMQHVNPRIPNLYMMEAQNSLQRQWRQRFEQDHVVGEK